VNLFRTLSDVLNKTVTHKGLSRVLKSPKVTHMTKVPGPKPRGSEIQATRVRKGLKRRALAEQAGLAWVTVYNLESGHQARTTWETLTRIAQVLEVPVSKLVEDENTNPNPPSQPKREAYPTTRPTPPGPPPPPRPTNSPTRIAEDAA
jgi:transcriptional regulator with XRE-family HTH domain